jgi:hypothetical protein
MPISIPSGRTLPLQSKAGGGFRSLGVGSGVPVNPGADPHDWQSLLTGTSGGTVDPKLNTDNFLTYLGAFRIGNFNGVEENPGSNGGSNGLDSITIKPANGTNGPNGSIFIAKWRGVAELEIPALSMTTDHTQLNNAILRQNFIDVFDRAPGGDINGADRIGWMRVNGSQLIMSSFKYYDGDASNSEQILVALDSSNMSGSAYVGGLPAWTDDRGARYAMDIPVEWQATFGYSHFCGVSTELAIAARSSFGHSLIGIDITAITASTASIPQTEWAHYTQLNPMNGYANFDIVNHYAPLAWGSGTYSLRDWYAPTDGRLFDAGGVDSNTLLAFTWLPVAETGRTTTLHQFPLPSGVRSHSIHTEMICGAAFIPPGSDSVVFIGNIMGARYGIGYKNFPIEDGPGPNYANTSTSPRAGGFTPISKTDRDNFIWFMNLNDVATATNLYDPQHYKFMPFVDTGPHTESHNIISGHYDVATNKLYLVSAGHSSASVDQQVVSVYQVGGVN